MARRNKRSSAIRGVRKNRIKDRESKIRKNWNKVVLTRNIINETMDLAEVENYRIEIWDEIRLVPNFGTWIIR